MQMCYPEIFVLSFYASFSTTAHVLQGQKIGSVLFVLEFKICNVFKVIMPCMRFKKCLTILNKLYVNSSLLCLSEESVQNLR